MENEEFIEYINEIANYREKFIIAPQIFSNVNRSDKQQKILQMDKMIADVTSKTQNALTSIRKKRPKEIWRT